MPKVFGRRSKSGLDGPLSAFFGCFALIAAGAGAGFLLGAYKDETRAEISSSVTETHQITRAMRASRFSTPSASSRAHTGAANARSNDPPAHRPPSPNLIQARNLPHRIHRETTVDATPTPVPPPTRSPRKHPSHAFVPHRASSRRRPRHHPRVTRPSGLDPERPRSGRHSRRMHPSVRRGRATCTRRRRRCRVIDRGTTHPFRARIVRRSSFEVRGRGRTYHRFRASKRDGCDAGEGEQKRTKRRRALSLPPFGGFVEF